jgi:hypothetical protein
MPESKLVRLLSNLQGFPYYYGGAGNFTQKNLGYGTGPEAEPYIRFPLPERASKAQADYYLANKASLDFPGRGTSFQTLGNGIIIPRAADYDAQRIQKFLKSNPKGYTFIAKQIGLQASNPKIEVGQQANLAAGNTTGRFYGMIENTRIYNGGVNTLTQVKLAGSGVHADRHGTVPYNPYSVSYEKTVEKYNKDADGSGNRLVMMLNNKMLGVNRNQVNPTLPSAQSNTDYFTNLDNLQRLGIPKSNENLLFQYPGGPGSLYGLGVTTIRRYVDTNAGTDTLSKLTPARPNNGAKTYNYALISQQNPISKTGQFQDFRQVIDPKFNTSAKIPASGSYIVPKEIDTALHTDTLQQIPGWEPTNNTKTFNYSMLANIPKERVFSKGGTTKDFRADINAEIPSAPALPTYDTAAANLVPTSDKETPKNINTALKTDTLTQIKNFTGKDPNNGAKTFNYTLLKNVNTKSKEYFDFREDINLADSEAKLATGSYGTQNMVRRIGTSNAGSKNFQADKLNMLQPGQDYPDEISHNKDLVKLRFEAIEYTGTGTKTVPIIFRSYLTSLTDTHNGEFSPFRYVGRGENFYTYTGFTRAISFGFKIAAESRQEMEPLYKRLKYLLSQVYPDYNDIGFMRAPIMKLTIGEYLYRQPGFLTNLTVTVQDSYPWEINIDGDKFEAPQILDVSCQFTPIHDFLPRRSSLSNQTPLIVPVYRTKTT